jgi:tetratricopeptide (TPR) repeat protein
MKYFIYLFFFCGSLFAQGENLFDQATKAYSEGNYEQAIANYEQILENGKTSAAVYYNLGNAHYQLDNVAESIYFYEKALQLKPNDQDIQNNLAFAEKKAIDAIETVPKTGVGELFEDMLSILGYDGWAWAAVVASVLFALLFLGYYFSKTPSRKRLFFVPAMICLVIGVAAFVFANLRQETAKNRQFAIVFATEAQVKSAPNPQSEMVFLLHEGTKVRVLEDFGEWNEIKLSDGKKGWIRKSEVKKL